MGTGKLLFTIVTRYDIYKNLYWFFSSRHLLQGGREKGINFQAVLQNKFEGHVSGMIQWMDDLLLF